MYVCSLVVCVDSGWDRCFDEGIRRTDHGAHDEALHVTTKDGYNLQEKNVDASLYI